MEMSRRVGTIRCSVIALALMVWWCQHTIVAFVRHGSQLTAKIHQRRPVFMSGSPYYVSQEAIDVPKLAGGMKYRQLHHSDLKISYVGIGTLAFGEQVSRSTAFALLDKATKDYAVNFLDTSEGFPMPLAETTYGHAELIVGDWLKQNPASFRDKVVISTKVVGSCPKIDWMRTDNSKGTRVNAKQVEEAVDNSLRRLKVDHIDVLSFQWPDRYVVINGADQYYDELEVKDATPFREQLELMQRLIQKGKVRHFALSNETPYGVGSWTTLADAHGLPRPLFTSNQYSLMDRYDFETGMKEALSNAKMPLVAYSPLAGGALTGKYSRPFEDIDANARMKRFPGFYARYVTEECRQAIKEYLHIAEENYAALAPLALAWVYQQPFVVSTLIGATTVQQLEQNILANNFTPLNDDVNAAFDRVYRQNPSAGRGPAALNDPRIETFDPRRRPWGLREEDLDPELAQLLDEVYMDGEDE